MAISLLVNSAVEKIADLDVTYLAADTAAERIFIIFIHHHSGLLPRGMYNQSRSLWLCRPLLFWRSGILGKVILTVLLLCKLGVGVGVI